MTFVEDEIVSQPDCWAAVVEQAASFAAILPQPGERVAVVGCGTSWYMAQCYAAMREGAGLGHTDAFAASEASTGRDYDRIVAITRSGTTTEVLDVLIRARDRIPTVATTALTLLRAHLGHDLTAAIADARVAVAEALPDGAADRGQFTFLGRGWTVGLANEAALKMREASLSWAESYPAMEYRHGPISIGDARSLVWMLGAAPDGLRAEVSATGATWVSSELDPLADLIRAQRLAIAVGHARGLDPDNPRNLSRSVILDPA